MALLTSILLLFHLVGPMPLDLGISQGQLSPCPGPAHCAHVVWKSTDPVADLATLSDWLAKQPRTAIVELTPHYLHAEVSSAFFGFVDDLEILASRGSIQTRSISRLGDSDLGVNARRLTELRSSLYADF